MPLMSIVSTTYLKAPTFNIVTELDFFQGDLPPLRRCPAAKRDPMLQVVLFFN